MKRESTEMDENDWQKLHEIASKTESLYREQPSWRRLLLRIARGELQVKEVSFIERCKLSAARKGKRIFTTEEQSEKNRKYHERKRRAAGIGPRGAQEALAVAMGYPQFTDEEMLEMKALGYPAE